MTEHLAQNKHMVERDKKIAGYPWAILVIKILYLETCLLS